MERAVFADFLQQMIDHVDGAESAAIMGHDGMIVERAVRKPEKDLDLIAAEYTSLLNGTMRTAGDTGLGAMSEVLIATEQAVLITKVLGHEYFLLMILAPDGNLGRARFEMRKAQLILEHEFTI
jgi:predicted regulator of Ras-like GTPase activity (Roadblock/LC7/MglB family)